MSASVALAAPDGIFSFIRQHPMEIGVLIDETNFATLLPLGGDMEGQLWIEPVGDVIIARMRGIPTETLLKECQERILNLVKDTEKGFARLP